MLFLQQIAAIAAKELKLLRHDRQALALLFLMPAFFILVMSFALEGVFEAGTRGRPLEILVVNQDRGNLAARTLEAARKLEGLILVESGENGPLNRGDAEAMIRNGSSRFALVFGPDYSSRLMGEKEEMGNSLTLIVDPAVNGQLQAMVKGAVETLAERTRLAVRLTAELRNVITIRTGVPSELPPAMGVLLADSTQRLSPEVIPPEGFSRGRRPTSTEQNVPAYAIFGVFFIALTIAKSFLRERTDGTYVRLRTAPLAEPVLIVGKLLPYFLVNLVQVTLMFAIGALVFGMKLGDPLAFILMSLATTAAANGLGVLIAALGRSEAQVDTLAVLFAITLSAIGGIMVPIYVMPEVMQTLSRIAPHAWALAGYQDVIVRGLAVREVLPEVGVLLGFAVGFMGVGLWQLQLR